MPERRGQEMRGWPEKVVSGESGKDFSEIHTMKPVVISWDL